ncbi:MAG: hypothetical protein SV765_03750 [Pseudomonadota bacterium]|nr:hypothetical protein [Pseudomonadales bacterium]MDY6919309.1 hypothetical protein [Pseudomonadota bacterium]
MHISEVEINSLDDFADFFREQSQRFEDAPEPSQDFLESRYHIFKRLSAKLGKPCEMKLVRNEDGTIGIDYRIA